jgi:hypothetical protein
MPVTRLDIANVDYELSLRRQPVPGLIDSSVEELDSSIRDLRRQLSTLEAFRRQLVGGDDPTVSGETIAASARAA